MAERDRRVGAVGNGLALAALTAGGMLPGIMLPVIVTVARRGLGFTLAQAGWLAAADIYGAAAGALVLAFIGTPHRWRRTAALALIGLILIDLGSSLLAGFAPLMAARVARGLAGGVLMGLGYAAIGRSDAPARLFGLLLIVQFIVGGLAIALLPQAVLGAGPWLLFAVLAAASALLLGLLPLLHVPDAASARAAHGARAAMPLVAALLALALFQAAHTAGGAYLIEIGRAQGFGLGFTQRAAGVAGMSGALGAMAAAALGERFGRLGPVLLATMFGIVGGLMLVIGAPLAFAVGAALGAVSWGVSIPYVLALCAAMDAEGRGAALASFAAKVGLASGPVLGAAVLGGGGPAAVVLLGCLLSVAAAALLVGIRRLAAA